MSDSQSTRGMQRGRVKRYLRYVLRFIGAVVGFLFAIWVFIGIISFPYIDDPPREGGDLPFEKRVSIEAFQRDVEPRILSARNEIFSGSQSLRPETEKSKISRLYDGWELSSQRVRGGTQSPDRVEEILGRYLEPLGYVSVVHDQDWLVWRDEKNGGHVEILIWDQSLAFQYDTQDRPSDGSVSDPRVLIPNDSRDIAGYVSDSLPSVRYLDGDAPEFPETDGSEWAEKRQSIEVFQRDVEPGILSFRDEIVGDSPYYVAPSPSEMETRKSYPPPEYWLESQRVQCGPRDVGRVIEWGNAHLNPLGYELVYDYASPVPGVGHYLAWKDEKNGGIVTVILREKNTEFSYESGARPSDGSVPDPTVLIPNDHRDLPDPLA
ncbi:DUF4853 domain-containing protein [uncultured Actinomyces sp.]|uniref:DUF4853 domain-containing protein n=1 Tax=uncultured Actinomyces sp. TaxID=249061 RepID=UPI0028E8F0B6|nr:DUF4853 domain-containing protein [uncultured Actinomyces sp.]